MRKFLPRRRSPSWFGWGMVFAVAFTLLYIAVYAWGYGRELAHLNIPGIVLIFTVICQLMALGGFFGFCFYLVISAAGFLLGLAFFLSMLTPSTGFEDLVGAISFLFFTAVGQGAGVLAELLRWVYRKYRGRNSR
jgi:hypothetical protein